MRPTVAVPARLWSIAWAMNHGRMTIEITKNQLIITTSGRDRKDIAGYKLDMKSKPRGIDIMPPEEFKGKAEVVKGDVIRVGYCTLIRVGKLPNNLFQLLGNPRSHGPMPSPTSGLPNRHFYVLT